MKKKGSIKIKKCCRDCRWRENVKKKSEKSSHEKNDCKNEYTTMTIAMKKMKLDQEDEGVPSTAIREVYTVDLLDGAVSNLP